MKRLPKAFVGTVRGSMKISVPLLKKSVAIYKRVEVGPVIYPSLLSEGMVVGVGAHGDVRSRPARRCPYNLVRDSRAVSCGGNMAHRAGS